MRERFRTGWPGLAAKAKQSQNIGSRSLATWGTCKPTRSGSRNRAASFGACDERFWGFIETNRGEIRQGEKTTLADCKAWDMTFGEGLATERSVSDRSETGFGSSSAGVQQ